MDESRLILAAQINSAAGDLEENFPRRPQREM